LAFFGADEGLELGMGCEDVLRHGAEDVDAEPVVLRVLERCGDQLERDALAALRLGYLGVPEGHPAMAVGFEFEIAGLAILHDLEAAAGDLGGVAHGGSSLVG
jgi:hypothetical protein